jgi:hypothetical protein
MQVTRVVHQLLEEIGTLQQCYSVLRYHSIESWKLRNSIEMLEDIVRELKRSPQVQKEIEGKDD